LRIFVLRASIESLLKEAPRNSPAHIAAAIQGHAHRLGINKVIASNDKDTHMISNLGEEHDTDKDTSFALPPDDTPNDELDLDVIRAWESNSKYFLYDGEDHRLAICPQLARFKGNDLTIRVFALLPLVLAEILARTIVPLARMPGPAKTPGLALTVAHRKFVVSKIRMTDLPVMNPRSRILVRSSPNYQSDDEGLLDECGAVVRSVDQVKLLPPAAELDSATAAPPALPIVKTVPDDDPLSCEPALGPVGRL
jgi:hypothetical protein